MAGLSASQETVDPSTVSVAYPLLWCSSEVPQAVLAWLICIIHPEALGTEINFRKLHRWASA